MMGLIRFLFSKEYLPRVSFQMLEFQFPPTSNDTIFSWTKEAIIRQISNLIICWYQIVEIQKVCLENWGEKFNLKPQSRRKS